MNFNIFHSENLVLDGKTIHRNAARAVIHKNNKLLMILSEKKGDYKFPGGGIKDNESYQNALKREVIEECGVKIIDISKKIIEIIEHNKPIEQDFDLFVMKSSYYQCSISEFFFDQNLETYEKELGFKPVWITIDKALSENKKLIETDIGETFPWLKREIRALEYLVEYIFV